MYDINKKTTAKELFDMIQSLKNKYKVHDMRDEIFIEFASRGIFQQTESTKIFNITEYFLLDEVKKMNGSYFSLNMLSPKEILDAETAYNKKKEEYKNFAIGFYDIYEKFNYTDYIRMSTALRAKFNSFRNSYIYYSFINMFDGRLMPGNCITEEAFSEWIDFNMEEANKQNCDTIIQYEDFEGNKKSIITCPHYDISVDDDDNFLCRPKPYWYGDSPLDGFRVTSFWDVDENRWEEVPVQLIKNIGIVPRETEDYEYDDDDDDIAWN